MKNRLETLKGFLNWKTVFVVFLSLAGHSCTTNFEDEGLFDKSKPELYALSTNFSFENNTNSSFYNFREPLESSAKQNAGLVSQKALRFLEGQILDTIGVLNFNYLDTEYFLSKKLKKKDDVAPLNRYFKNLRESVS